jgi:long-chain acyl-CoA synthetase
MSLYAERPWLKSYQLGPYKLEKTLAPYPDRPVFAALEDAARSYPGQTAILFRDRAIRYQQLKELVDRLAAALAGLGVKKGDRVCVLLPNCLEFILSDWAIMKAGAAIVPTSVLRSQDGLQHEIGSAGARLVICQIGDLERVLALELTCQVEHIIVTSAAGFDQEALTEPLPNGVLEFRKLLHDFDPEPPAVKIDAREDLCELSFTGGATGTPKGVMITHYNRYSCILQGLAWFMKPILRGFAGKASVILPVPLFHTYGHFILQMATSQGLRIILLPDPRDTDMLVDQLRKYRPFLIPAVPTQLMRIADADLGRMNVLPMSGSAPLPKEVALAIKKRIGMPVSEGYGLTETSPVTHYNLSAFSKITGFIPKEKLGIGVPTPDTECRLVDTETGQDALLGEPGEIVVRGPQVMKGYWPEAGSGLTSDGWFHTGDIGVMDEDGYFQVVDRIKDMVNVSGMKVYTNSVDEVLFKHPAVLMAAAFGVPDPARLGSERVAAVIRLKEDFQDCISGEQIQDFCREHLPAYAVPIYIEFRPELPLTVSEKLFKKTLREEAIARMKAAGEIPD